MLKIQSIIKFTSVSHLSKTSNILNCPLYLGMTGCMTVQGHCTAEVVESPPLCNTGQPSAGQRIRPEKDN